MLRVIRTVRPTWVIAENVRGLLSIEQGVVFEQVCVDLENEGYEVQPIIIPACALNAPHRRDRVWFIAHARHVRQEKPEKQTMGSQQLCENTSNPQRQRHQGEKYKKRQSARYDRGPQPSWNAGWPQVAAELCSMDARIPYWMDGYIKTLIRTYGTAPHKRTAKNLQALWQAIQSSKIREKVGGLFTIQKKEVLFTVLREFMEGIRKSRRLSEQSTEAQEEVLRNMWEGAEFGCSPQERRHYEQQARELTNIVPQLSYETALAFTEMWHCFWRTFSQIYGEKIELGEFKLSKAGHRNAQIKAYGNAIVPQVAYEIFKNLK